jgi:hypothetical protein
VSNDVDVPPARRWTIRLSLAAQIVRSWLAAGVDVWTLTDTGSVRAGRILQRGRERGTWIPLDADGRGQLVLCLAESLERGDVYPPISGLLVPGVGA